MERSPDNGCGGLEGIAFHSMATESGDDELGCDYCPHFQHALELVGRRWTGSILKVIGDRTLRFGEIRAEIPGLSDRLLDTRLSELEAEGLIRRSTDDGAVRYAASDKGIAIRPAFATLADWARAYPAPAQGDALPGRRRD